uniref:Mitochondrial nucleoid factor 1 n=1 Tax=Capra hircus TaxID=9925 RepID=A0A8C2RF28_CAPHI
MASGRDQTGPGLGRLSAAAGSAGLSGGREHPVAGKTGPEWEALLCSVFVPVEGRDRQSCARPRGSLHLNGNAEHMHGTLVCVSSSSLILSAAEIVEPEACDQMYESLARLHSNYYKHKYPRPRDTSFSGLSLEEYKLILSTDTLDEFKEMNKGTWKKLQEKFAPRSPEGKHTAWARALPRPRT